MGRRHNRRWTHSPQTRSRNKMAVFWSNFGDFVGAQKFEDLTESTIFRKSISDKKVCFSEKRKKKGGGGGGGLGTLLIW